MIAIEYRGGKVFYKALAEKYNIGIRTIRTADELTNEIINIDSDNSFLQKHNKINKPINKYIAIDNFILESLTKLRKHGGIINRLTVKQLTKKYVEQNNMTIKPTNYFVKTFIKRHNITYLKLHGESKSAKIDDVNEFYDNFENISKKFSRSDIFNIDETFLYIKNVKERSYVFDKTDNKGIKLNKVRITVALAMNCFNENLPILLVGKSKNPRCMKNEDPYESLKYFIIRIAQVG